MAVSRSIIAAFMLALIAAPAVARVSRDLLESEVVSSEVDSGGEEYTPSPPADGYVYAENTKHKETAAYDEETTNYEEPMHGIAASSKDFYVYTSGMMCAGEPLQAIEGEATVDSCRMACDQFFGCNSFTYSTNMCMLYNKCPNKTMVANPEAWSGILKSK